MKLDTKVITISSVEVTLLIATKFIDIGQPRDLTVTDALQAMAAAQPEFIARCRGAAADVIYYVSERMGAATTLQ